MEAAERLADWLLNRKRKALVSNIPEVARLLAKGFIDGFEAPINVITNATFELSHIAFAIAQHFGYPTSLLDWTTDLDVAAFFATLGNFDRENGVGVIFALNLRDGVPPDDSLFGLHNSLIGVRKTEFSGIKRIDAQKGLFCIDPNLRTEIAIKMPWFDYITHMTFNHSDRYISHIANDRVIFPSDCKIARLITGYKST